MRKIIIAVAGLGWGWLSYGDGNGVDEEITGERELVEEVSGWWWRHRGK